MSGSTSWMDAMPKVNPTPGMIASGAVGAPPSQDIPTMTIRPQTGDGSWMDSMPKITPTPGMIAAGQGEAPPKGSSWKGIAKNAAAGVVDAGEGLLNVASDPFGNLIGKPLATGLTFAHDALAPVLGYPRFSDDTRNMLLGDQTPQPGTRTVNAVGAALGAPSTADIPANSPTERLTRKMVGAAGQTAALGPAGLLGPALGAGGALVGDQAAQAVPAWAQPMAELTGNTAGAGATALGVHGLRTGGQLVAGKLGQWGVGPKTANGDVSATSQQALAAGQKLDTMLGPEGRQSLQTFGENEAKAKALEAQLADPATEEDKRPAIAAQLAAIQPNREQLVPGYQPTTAQLVPNQNTVGFERDMRTLNNDQFAERGRQNNTALTGAIQAEAPGTTGPQAVSDMFMRQLDALQTRQATQAAEAKQGIVSRTAGVGEDTPAAYGSQIRAQLQDAQAPIHAATSALWSKVDPEGKWAISATPLQEAAAGISKEMSPTAQVDSQEAGVIQRAKALPPVVQFQQLGQLRADINQALSRVVAQPGMLPNVRRLTLLKQGLDQSISDAVDHISDVEGGVEGRLTTDLGQPNEPELGRAGQPGAGEAGDQAGGLAGSSRQNGAGVQGAGGRGVPTGDSGLAATGATAHLPGDLSELEHGIYADLAPESVGPKLSPNITPENATAYRAAVGATRAEKERFARGGVGNVLRPGRNYEDWRTPNGDVPRQIFTRAPTEPAEVQRFITAVGGPEQAAAIGQNVLVNELRDRGIVQADGTVNAGKFAAWQRQRAATISQFPGLPEKFRDWQTAQITLDKTVADHVDALRDFQNGAAKHFLSADPQVAVGRLFSSGNSTLGARQLYAAVKDNPDALAGLRRGFVDYLDRRFNVSANPDETGSAIKSKAFRDFMGQHRNAFKIVFGGQGAQNIEMVEAALNRTARAQQTEATLGSNTVQKAVAASKHGAHLSGGAKTTLFALLGEKLAEHAASMMGTEGALGMAASVGGVVGGLWLHAMRQAGIQTMADLGREMMLHPDIARMLLQRVDAQKAVSAIAQRKAAMALRAAVVADVSHSGNRDAQ